MHAPRHTARGIIIRDQEILLIERFRSGLHYFSIPGGGIETGETPEQTVIREVMEETSCTVALDRAVYILRRGDVVHHFFLCTYVAGDAHLPPDSEEAQHGADNRFVPTWLPLIELSSAPFLTWSPVQQQLIADLEHGFGPEPVEIVADPIT